MPSFTNATIGYGLTIALLITSLSVSCAVVLAEYTHISSDHTRMVERLDRIEARIQALEYHKP